MHLSRSRIIQIIFIISMLVFMMRLFCIQVISPEYGVVAENNIIQRVEQYPCRGSIYDRNKNLLVANQPIYDLWIVPNAAKGIDISAFCHMLKISEATFTTLFKRAKQFSCIQSSIFIKDIDHYELAKIQDQLVDYPGFYIKARTVRHYFYPALANTLGYLGEISAKQLADTKYQGYRKSDFIGISGLEAQYEDWLSGSRGIQYKIIDVRGREQGAFKNGILDVCCEPGKDLVISIDIDLQVYGELLLANKRGSIVALDPSTGQILAIVSSPSYDPNRLTTKTIKQNFAILNQDPDCPLFHRPIMAMYAPGSIFKLVQALIGLQEKVILPRTTYACHKKVINCHAHPSPVNLHKAIQYSCNTYFYHAFRSIINQKLLNDAYADTCMGLKKWTSYVKKFGLGSPLGIDLPYEKGGYVPNTHFYDAKYGVRRWQYTTIRSLDIGQGEILITPLQMANLAAIMANKGFYYTPHITQGIAVQKHVIDIAEEHFNLVVNAMEAVVANGSGSRAKIRGITVCGKTGTVENLQGKDHAVFMGFAPLDRPQIAIAVYVENAGWGSRSAAAIAGLMIEKYLKRVVSSKEMEAYVLKGVFED
jgi:penicillin-binding protein 2